MTAAVFLSSAGVAIVDTCFAVSIALVWMQPTNLNWNRFMSITPSDQLVLAIDHNRSLFIVLAIIFVLHVAAGVGLAIRSHLNAQKTKQNWRPQRSDETETTPTLLVEMLFTQIVAPMVLLSIQANIPQWHGYYGVTLLGTSTVSFIGFLILQYRQTTGHYSEILLNMALLTSTIGMFINTEGQWTAIVFLLFSCLMIYLSFVLGTLRTRVYAFVALTISMFKLYTECSELFESISGTSLVLVIGIILLGLSYKLETIKSFVKKERD